MRDIPVELWSTLSTLLDQALDLPSDEREAFLDAACGGDPARRRIVGDLLAAAEQDTEFLERPALSRMAGEERAGAWIGTYRLLQRVGEGGMGEIWRAEQEAPVRRRVALKMIKPGMDTTELIERFEAERQTLAAMDHPSIPKLLDAGISPGGHPYFVMEYIEGENIAAYCDRRRLSMRQRLELFAQVCAGVEHAHQKGVIHRDLKPANLLVSVEDDRPVPKIIDFGIAKSAPGPEGQRAMLTAPGVLLGTPQYMSPEQIAGFGFAADTRTDVYALGVILYELLTGASPFDRRGLQALSFDELLRKIREDDPPRPSTRIRALGPASAPAADNRRTNPRALERRLQGDLDWIVMKAMQKNPDRRYGSAAELAADIHRHLTIQPVLAGPPSAGYRALKLMRRHRLGMAAGAIMVLALAAFGVSAAAQAQRIARKRDQAEHVSQFFADLFQIQDAGDGRGGTITAREILDRGTERIDALADEEEVQSQLLHKIGTAYALLGYFAEGEPLLARSLEVRKRFYGPEHPLTRETIWGLANVQLRAGKPASGIVLMEEAVRQMREFVGPDDPLTIDRTGGLAYWYGALGYYERADRMLQVVYENNRRRYGPEDLKTLWVRQGIAANLSAQDRHEDAEAILRDIVTIAARRNFPRDAVFLGCWADELLEIGRPREAEPLLDEERELVRRWLGAHHPLAFSVTRGLARVYDADGRPDEGERLMRETLDGQVKAFGRDHPETLMTMRYLGILRADRGDFEEALRLLREALEGQRQDLGTGHHETMITARAYVRIAMRRGGAHDAEDVYAKAKAAWQPDLDVDRFGRRLKAYDLACLGALCGKRDEALQLLRLAVEGGFDRPERLEGEEDLQAIRATSEFGRLLAVTAKNASDGRSGGTSP